MRRGGVRVYAGVRVYYGLGECGNMCACNMAWEDSINLILIGVSNR